MPTVRKVKGQPLILVLIGAIVLGAWLLAPRSKSSPEHAQLTEESLVTPKLKLPSPKLKASHDASEIPPAPARGRIARLEQLQEQTKISPAQLEAYLASNKRSAGSLLAADAITGDRTLLKEAQAKYPQNPRVAYMSWFRSETPEEKRKWLETMKASEPNNSLASYLLSNELFKAGQQDQALQELQNAYQKPDLSDHALESIQDHEEAYLAAGLNELDAKALASMGHLLPQLANMKELGRSLTEMARGYTSANDGVSAEAVLQMALQMGGRLSTGQNFLIEQLVGIAIESNILKTMDPGSTEPLLNVTAAERLEQLERQRAEAKARTQGYDRIMEIATEEDLVRYFDRLKLFGEVAASEWLLNKYDHAK